MPPTSAAVAHGRLMRLQCHLQQPQSQPRPPRQPRLPARPALLPASGTLAVGGAGPAGEDWSVPLADSTGRRSSAAEDLTFFRKSFIKLEAMVPMRDGVSLFTVAFIPRPGSAAAGGLAAHPVLLQRTTYSCAPYGSDAWAAPRGPMKTYSREGFIFAQQDVRGRNASEGDFTHMRQHLDSKSSSSDVDESTDTYDTIEWLINNISSSNGRVGLLGISYPGFFAVAGMIDSVSDLPLFVLHFVLDFTPILCPSSTVSTRRCAARLPKPPSPTCGLVTTFITTAAATWRTPLGSSLGTATVKRSTTAETGRP